jgi:hypothetical protein
MIMMWIASETNETDVQVLLRPTFRVNSMDPDINFETLPVQDMVDSLTKAEVR